MKASECKCVECGAEAVAFWPIIDPDIPSHPYCRKCLDKAKMELLVNGFGYEKNDAKALMKIEEELRKGNEL